MSCRDVCRPSTIAALSLLHVCGFLARVPIWKLWPCMAVFACETRAGYGELRRISWVSRSCKAKGLLARLLARLETFYIRSPTLVSQATPFNLGLWGYTPVLHNQHHVRYSASLIHLSSTGTIQQFAPNFYSVTAADSRLNCVHCDTNIQV